MNQKDVEVPESLGGHGGMLPADVLKMLEELLAQLHQADQNHQGSIVINVYEKGSQHIDNQINIGAYPGPPKGRDALYILWLKKCDFILYIIYLAKNKYYKTSFLLGRLG